MPSSHYLLRKRTVSKTKNKENLKLCGSTAFLYSPPEKRLRRMDYSASLPDEILVHIMSYLPQMELIRNVRLVCKRWYRLSLTPTLWTTLSVNDEVPTQVLVKGIQDATLLQDLSLYDRTDVNEVLAEVAKHSKNLVNLKLQDCYGSKKFGAIQSTHLCNLVKRCKKLSRLHFTGVQIRSCKFFKMLSQKMRGRIAKKLSYYGPMNEKQMRAIFESLEYGMACLVTPNHKKICINDLVQRSNNLSETVDIIWNDIINNNLSETVDIIWNDIINNNYNITDDDII